MPIGLKEKLSFAHNEALGTAWSFWIEWYEAILNGTPLPWELTQRIALEVTEAEWDAGQKVVGARIAAIQVACESTNVKKPEVFVVKSVEVDAFEKRGVGAG